MKIIKSRDAGVIASYQHEPLDFHYDALLDSVGDEIHRRTFDEELRERMDAAVHEGYQEGLTRGEAAARAAFSASVGQAAEAMERCIVELAASRQRFLDNLEPQVLELTRSIAHRLLRREIKSDESVIRATVRSALENLVDREQVVIRLNPVELNAVREEKAALLDELDGIRMIEVIADAGIEPGGCVVESATLQVDARLDAQLDAILQELDR